MTVPSLADALNGGGKWIKWDDLGVGAIVKGTIVEIDVRQARKYQSDELAFWDDGKPQMQVVFSLQTELREGEDDEGLRSVSLNLWSGQKKALADACKAAGVKEPAVGQDFAIKWASGVGKAGDPRVFQVKLGPAPAKTAGLSDALNSAVSTPGGEKFPDSTPW